MTNADKWKLKYLNMTNEQVANIISCNCITCPLHFTNGGSCDITFYDDSNIDNEGESEQQIQCKKSIMNWLEQETI